MLPEQLQSSIARACVTVVKHDGGRGRGVLVPGNIILTAAHCVAYTTEGALGLGDVCIVEVETRQGPLHTQLLAVEPVGDIAVLGALDGQDSVDERRPWTNSVPPPHRSPSGSMPFPSYNRSRCIFTPTEANGFRAGRNSPATRCRVSGSRCPNSSRLALLGAPLSRSEAP